MVAGERPALPVARGYEVDRAGVRQGQLSVAIGRAVARALAAANLPVVADETVLEIELGLLDQLALVHRRAAHDQLYRALVDRRAEDFVETGLELLGRQLLGDSRGHAPVLSRRLR